MANFRTSAQRQEEQIRAAQGLPSQSSNTAMSTLGNLGLLNLLNQGSNALGSFGDGLFSSAPASSISTVGGVSSIPAGAAIPPGMEGIGTMANGGTMVGPAAATPGTFSLSGIGGAGNAILPIAGAFGLYDAIGKDREGARGYLQSGLSGAGMGSFFGPVGAAVGGGLGLLGKLGQDLFDSGKSRTQKERDTLRNFLEGQGFLKVQNGTHVNPVGGFDWGADGKNTLTNDAGVARRRFEVDFNDPRAAQTTAYLDPLGTLMAYQAGIGGGQRTNAVGYLVNDALSQGQDPQQTALAMYQRYGLSPDQVAQGLQELSQAGQLSPEQFQAMTNTVNSLSSPGQSMGGGSYTIPNSPQIRQLDLSMLQSPQDPLAQSRETMSQRQQMPVYNQGQMPNLFPSKGRQTYQPLLALGG
jgi:hypothetical protein